MKFFKFALIAVVAMFCASSCSKSSGEEELTGYVKVDAAGFKAYIAKDSVPQILDTRSASDYAKGHIPGAVNIDASNAADWASDNGVFMTKVKAQFKTSKKIYVYGTSGWSAVGMSLPGRIANTWGKPNTINLESGFEGWESAGFDVEK